MKKNKIYTFWNKLGISNEIINKILLKITGLSKNQLFLLNWINDEYIWKIEEYFSRIVSWEPIEYILKQAEFYWLDFYVDNRCLIPRNDTEIMVDKVLEINSKIDLLIDVWTWSSCIPISILENNKNIHKSFVIDIEKKALEVSKINIEKHCLENKIIQINWSLLDNFLLNTDIFNLNWDLNIWNLIITANLPYIKNWDFDNMDFETMEYEPDSALYWWKDTWFELYEKLILQCLELKSIYNIDKLLLFIEIWFDQKDIAKTFLTKLNLKFEIFRDNWWIDRCIKIFIK